MISLKKYLDNASVPPGEGRDPIDSNVTALAIAVYGSSLAAMGNCGLDVCPALGNELKGPLDQLSRHLSRDATCDMLTATDKEVQERLRDWGRRTARYYQQKSGQVKDLLIMMARTAESVGLRDQRCAGQIHEVTAQLTAIASLDDLTEIRASIEKSAAELKSSIDRMTEEGKAAIDQLQDQVSKYRAKLEAAEVIASRDALTGLRSRVFVENLIERHIAAGTPLSIAIVDIDGFKKVNDENGHLIGDELLKQFASELVSACRSTDGIGRWGGDEFIIVLESPYEEASAQTERLRKWICGNYTIPVKSGSLKLAINASIGLAEHQPNETVNDLIARADAAMYQNKAASRASETDNRRRA